MKTVEFFRTVSYGGMEGRDRIVEDFETEELARAEALRDTWNDCYTLYKVVMTFDGVIKTTEERIGKIPCGRDMRRG